MKVKAKRDIKQAERFITELQSQVASSFADIAQLLTMYEAREVERDAVFSSLVGQIKQHPQLLQQFNAFLLPEKKVVIVPPDKIQQMLTVLLHELNKKYSEDLSRFHSFIDFFYIISKERIDRECFTSYPDMVNYTLREIHNSPEIRELGEDFIADIDQIMRQYLESVLSQPLVFVEPPPEEAEAVFEPEAAPELPAPKPQAGSTTAPKRSKARAAAPAEREPAEPKPVPVPAKPAEPPAEEPAVENLRVEENVFRALRQKLSAGDFQCLARNLQLYTKNVISYFEFVKLSERLLLRVEKEVCMALKEIVEGRERSRTANNLFNIKLQLQELQGQAENRSYKRITTAELNSDAGEHALINKTFMATARGNESAVNFDEGLHRKAVENLAEKALFRAEDEVHEFDSVLHQTRVALGWVRALRARELGRERALLLCRKLANARVLSYLYGAKAAQIIEELKNRPPELIEMIEKRVGEKIAILETARREFAEKSWQPLQQASYYKALDARLNSLKFAEKRFFNNRGFLGRLREPERAEGAVLGDSLALLLHGRKTPAPALDPASAGDPAFWNPAICFALESPAVMADVLFFLRAFIRLSKMSGSEKERAASFFERAFGNFLRIDGARPAAVASPLPTREQLVERVAHYERWLYPRKVFYFADKLSLKLDEANFAAANGFFGQQDAAPRTAGPAEGEELSRLRSREERRPDRPSKSDANDRDSAAELNPNPREPGPERPREMVIEAPESPRPDRAFFYASQQFFLAYQHFVFLYERLKLACEFSLAALGDCSLYEFFKQVLFMHLFGILDATQYEDAVRMLFDQQGGVFLHFDKLLGHSVKNVPSDDFSSFVLSLNSATFDAASGAPKAPEAVLFAKTYTRILEQSAIASKNSKPNGGASAAVSAAPADLLKFDMDFASGMFIVHKVRVAPEGESRSGAAGSNVFVEESYPVLTRPLVPAVHPLRGHAKAKRWVSNGMVHYFNLKKQELTFAKAGAEDLIFRSHKDTAGDARKKRILKLERVKKFRNARAARLGSA